VLDLLPGEESSYPSDLVNVKGVLYFSAVDGVHGRELWKSTGTAANTRMVKDILPGNESSSPRGLTNVKGNLFFAANDAVHGEELWRSNGAAAGTLMVKDINPGPGGSMISGTTNLNGTLMFAAHDPTNGLELWRSNSTEQGTVLVKDINPSGNGLTTGAEMLNQHGTLYFVANDGLHGEELWQSGIFGPSSKMVADIRPGAESSKLFNLTEGGPSFLIFSADDGEHGFEIWTLTSPANAGSPMAMIESTSVTAVGNSTEARHHATETPSRAGANGNELWRSTAFGPVTIVAADINPGGENSNPSLLASTATTLFFAASNGASGNELWTLSNPTSGGVFAAAGVSEDPEAARVSFVSPSISPAEAFEVEIGSSPWLSIFDIGDFCAPSFTANNGRAPPPIVAFQTWPLHPTSGVRRVAQTKSRLDADNSWDEPDQSLTQGDDQPHRRGALRRFSPEEKELENAN
jgi:ELWxxDGT repeat protein